MFRCWLLPCALAAALVLLTSAAARAEDAPGDLPETRIRYRIEVRFDPQSRHFEGTETLRWRNPAARAWDAVPLHLYLNAFANRGSTWMRESFQRGIDWDEFLAQYDDPWGWIEPARIRQNGRELAWKPIQPDDDNPLDRTLIEVKLAEPVEPDAWLELSIEFAGRLPVPIARTGCVPDYCLVAHWFPKIGVLETPGVRHAAASRWAARQFHGPTEFYADFADYDVSIDAPAGWLVGATGRRAPSDGEPPAGMQRVRHVQRAVHDFAIVLGRELFDVERPHRPLDRGHTIEVRYVFADATPSELVTRAERAVEGALDTLAAEVGPYPYETLTVVSPPYRGRRTAGMEYPTLITGLDGDPRWSGFPLGSLRLWDSVLVHEFGHQYFYGLLASNEQLEAFLDEGFNSYWDTVGMQRLFGTTASAGTLLGRPLDQFEFRSLSIARSRASITEAIRKQPSALFYPDTPRIHIYSRPASMLVTAARTFGRERLHRVFREYYRRHRFGHPDTEDFLSAARDAGGGELEAFLRETLSRRPVPDYEVTELTSRRALLPLGRYVREGAEPLWVDAEARARGSREHDALLAGERARDAEGKVWLLVTDPGYVDDWREEAGSTEWVGLSPVREADRSASGVYHESTVRLRGPGWRHLPVDVELRFSDGVVVRDRWDGRSTWRGYHVLRRASLVEVVVDPEQRIALDPLPHNDGMRLRSDDRMTSDWSGWLGALAQWLAGGLSWWL